MNTEHSFESNGTTAHESDIRRADFIAGQEGDIRVADHAQRTVQAEGGRGNLILGGMGSEGDLALLDPRGKQTIHLDGGNANLELGGQGHNADIYLMNARGKQTIHIDAESGEITVNGIELLTVLDDLLQRVAALEEDDRD